MVPELCKDMIRQRYDQLQDVEESMQVLQSEASDLLRSEIHMRREHRAIEGQMHGLSHAPVFPRLARMQLGGA